MQLQADHSPMSATNSLVHSPCKSNIVTLGLFGFHFLSILFLRVLLFLPLLVESFPAFSANTELKFDNFKHSKLNLIGSCKIRHKHQRVIVIRVFTYIHWLSSSRRLSVNSQCQGNFNHYLNLHPLGLCPRPGSLLQSLR